VLVVRVKAVEVRGRRVRVLARRVNSDIIIEMTKIWDPAYDKPVVLVTSRDRLRDDVESLINEIAFLLRELVEKLVEEAERSEVQ
jgi:hypothetical protein